MKEIMVIKDEQAIDEWNRTIAQFIDVDNKIYKAEFIKVPETWEELKELCKGIKGVEYAGGNTKGEIIEISNIWFAENGEIWGYTDDFTGICNISKDRTPQQMWQIIMVLLGEK